MLGINEAHAPERPGICGDAIRERFPFGSAVTRKLEIDAEVSSGLDRAKVRTLIEKANTLGFIEESVERVSSSLNQRRIIVRPEVAYEYSDDLEPG